MSTISNESENTESIHDLAMDVLIEYRSIQRATRDTERGGDEVPPEHIDIAYTRWLGTALAYPNIWQLSYEIIGPDNAARKSAPDWLKDAVSICDFVTVEILADAAVSDPRDDTAIVGLPEDPRKPLLPKGDEVAIQASEFSSARLVAKINALIPAIYRLQEIPAIRTGLFEFWGIAIPNTLIERLADRRPNDPVVKLREARQRRFDEDVNRLRSIVRLTLIEVASECQASRVEWGGIADYCSNDSPENVEKAVDTLKYVRLLMQLHDYAKPGAENEPTHRRSAVNLREKHELACGLEREVRMLWALTSLPEKIGNVLSKSEWMEAFRSNIDRRLAAVRSYERDLPHLTREDIEESVADVQKKTLHAKRKLLTLIAAVEMQDPRADPPVDEIPEPFIPDIETASATQLAYAFLDKLDELYLVESAREHSAQVGGNVVSWEHDLKSIRVLGSIEAAGDTDYVHMIAADCRRAWEQRMECIQEDLRRIGQPIKVRIERLRIDRVGDITSEALIDFLHDWDNAHAVRKLIDRFFAIVEAYTLTPDWINGGGNGPDEDDEDGGKQVPRDEIVIRHKHLRVLNLLCKAAAPWSKSKIASDLHLGPKNVREIIKDLESLGLVERPNAAGENQQAWRPTAAGRAKIDGLSEEDRKSCQDAD